MLTTWQHWFASDLIGIISVAPLMIGLTAAIRQPPPRSELIEGAVALLALALMTAIAISLPWGAWETVMPVALLFPMLLWVAARCQPVFTAAAAFLVSITIVVTAVFDFGHFGDPGVSYADQQAQAAILFVAVGAYVLAALFAERRESEARLARANVMLESERDNKLMSAQAIAGAIAHEVRQPLTGIVTNASAALRWLGKSPPDHDRVRAALDRVQSNSHRTSEVFDAIRALFRKGDQGRQRIAVNEIIVALLITGEIAAAQAHYSQGLALYDPIEHRPFATRFGQDISVANMSFRSLALWLLGYPERALADANRALKDAQEIGQAATLMFALTYAAKAQTHCGHFAHANSLLEQVIALADQKSSPYWKGFGMSEQACALVATGDTSAAVHQFNFVEHSASARGRASIARVSLRCLSEPSRRSWMRFPG